jgi:hypothetical protein
MWRSHWERRVEHTTREGDAPEGNGAADWKAPRPSTPPVAALPAVAVGIITCQGGETGCIGDVRPGGVCALVTEYLRDGRVAGGGAVEESAELGSHLRRSAVLGRQRRPAPLGFDYWVPVPGFPYCGTTVMVVPRAGAGGGSPSVRVGRSPSVPGLLL